jgi:glucose-6-phosphate isomerase
MFKDLELFPNIELKSSAQDESVAKNFFSLLDDPRNSFFHLMKRTDLLTQSQEIFLKFHKKKHIVLLGIGGSSLGPEMLIKSLKPVDCERKFYVLNNIDSQEFFEVLTELDRYPVEETLFIVTSKSGSTIETTAGLAILNGWLDSKGIGSDKTNQHFVFITDPVKSELLTLAKKYHIDCLEVPQTIGGRFSVLSPVGLLPALFANISADELWKGALAATEEIKANTTLDNPILALGKFIYEHSKAGQNQTVFMPYSSKLKELSLWFVQLWAESLGKEKSLNGETVNVGLTPIPAHGATDQHSQMQLFMEGPFDKVLFIIEVENRKHDFALKSSLDGDALNKLTPFTLNQLMKAEFVGALKALKQNQRPLAHMKIKELTAYELGHAILELESLTALMSVYFNIDCFDQPGVEASKKYALEWLDSNKNK